MALYLPGCSPADDDLGDASQGLTGSGPGVGAGVAGTGNTIPGGSSGPSQTLSANCSGAQLDCGGVCTDTLTDSLHCGACSQSCQGGTACAGSGLCQCPLGSANCTGACVEVGTDANHCGGCGIRCEAGETCAGGQCSCQPGLMDCNGICVDLAADGLNCGACGSSCGVGQVCSLGQCAASCAPGRMQCGTGCVDVASSPLHCRACSNRCAAGQSCQASTCNCPAGQINCAGQCVDPSSNAGHCGTCGVACQNGQICQGGSCSCPPGQTSCNGSCVNLQSNAAHCGSCNSTCNGVSCLDGACALPPAPTLPPPATVQPPPGTAGPVPPSPTAGPPVATSTTPIPTSPATPSVPAGPAITPIQGGCNGFATRYWDCCKLHCGWEGNTNGLTPLTSCNQQDQSLGGDFGVESSCTNTAPNNAYTCSSMAPWTVNGTLSYGFAAVPSTGDICGRCYQIQFTGGNDAGSLALVGKEMIVQAINIGFDVAGGQFDLLVPGGGVGNFNACSAQWGAQNNELGQQFGGLLATCRQNLGFNAPREQVRDCLVTSCSQLFGSRGLSELEQGCLWYNDWFEAADNPSLVFREVECPQDIISVSNVDRRGRNDISTSCNN